MIYNPEGLVPQKYKPNFTFGSGETNSNPRQKYKISDDERKEVAKHNEQHGFTWNGYRWIPEGKDRK